MKSQTGKIFSFVIALCILLSVVCFASTQVNAAMPEDYNKSGAGPAKIDALKEPLKGKAVSLIQAVYEANTDTLSIFEVAPDLGIVVIYDTEVAKKYAVTGQIISQTENKIVFRTDLKNKADGTVMNERLDGPFAVIVNNFKDGTAYSVGEDGVWHELKDQYNFGTGLSLYVRPGYEVVIVK